MIKDKKRPEILAPCGSYDILTAAVRAGADACYIGGTRFGARAYAENFSDEKILDAIDFSHLHGAKLYLAVNTLFKDNEIEELYDYILPFYEAGLDAAIVQDLGAFFILRENFPDLSLHLSTQMNITSVYAAKYMEEQGASRIVTAREMTLDEIRQIKKETKIEVETFVHGAMCYSYSGRCLMSSLAGGRSGNRGRCAQPCRKCYDGEYLLSMKDMCTLEYLPELCEAGIDSFKIEGRMKNVSYVTSAVRAYRELAEDCIRGCFSMEKALQQKKRLADIYNRGGFCSGYFFPEKEEIMVSKDRPNHRGVCIGTLVQSANGQIVVELAEDLYESDVLELYLKDGSPLSLTTKKAGKKGERIALNAPKTRYLLPGQQIYRTRCDHLLNLVQEEIPIRNYLGITGVFRASAGAPMELTVTRIIGEKEYTVQCTGALVEASKNQAANEEEIKARLSRLGDTPYFFEKLTAEISPNVFLPVGKVKELRRTAIDKLNEEITKTFRRREEKGKKMSADRREPVCLFDLSSAEMTGEKTKTPKLSFRIEVSDARQLALILKEKELLISAVYLDRNLYDTICVNGQRRMLEEQKTEVFLMLPYIVHHDFQLSEYLPKDGINGIYIRNIDEFAIVAKALGKNGACGLCENDGLQSFSFVLGASLYAYNHVARAFLKKLGGSVIFEMPKELNLKEYEELCSYAPSDRNEFTVYEYQQIMLSAQCIRKNRKECVKDHGPVTIRDDRGNTFFVKTVCGECCNVIYNKVPLLADKPQILKTASATADSLKAAFHFEDEAQTEEVLRLLRLIQEEDTLQIQKNDKKETTTGHLLRGVI